MVLAAAEAAASEARRSVEEGEKVRDEAAQVCLAAQTVSSDPAVAGWAGGQWEEVVVRETGPARVRHKDLAAVAVG